MRVCDTFLSAFIYLVRTSVDIEFLTSISDIDQDEWNALTGNEYPFIRWEFLYALESTGAVSTDTGWQPQHVLVREKDKLIALMPMYLKGHSQGEYVFDHSWADAYYRHGMEYYPKWLSAIPFTPCQGPRLCFSHELAALGFSESSIVSGLLSVFENLSAKHGISSWHCLFPEREDFEHWSSDKLMLREAVQFQWFNKSYQSFDDFLNTFTSKRRKNIKRERRRVQEQGIEVLQLTGQEITLEHWQTFFKFYQATYWKRGMPEYLSLEFFLEVSRLMPDRCLLVLAQKEGEIVAGALSIVGNHTLYGRYWGCLEEYDNLHFELCYYQGLEYCINHNLQCFNSGAQGEHKIARGFEPVKTYSLHWVAHSGFREAIENFLDQENRHIDSYQNAASELLPFKNETA